MKRRSVESGRFFYFVFEVFSKLLKIGLVIFTGYPFRYLRFPRMKLNYQLDHSDYLAYQLYTSSRSKSHKKKRLRNRVLLPIFFLGLGTFTAITSDDLVVLFSYAGIAILWFLLYPLYSGWLYKNHFKKHVKETYKNRIHVPVEIVFQEDLIVAKDATSETKISTTELKELTETCEHFFLKLRTDTSLVFPKHFISKPTEFKNYFKDQGVSYVNELNWRWS
ncbi:MAG: hypothetical protein CMF36_08005 [Leeuwenhoekiella sp.]|nr:hypothetical protein [Leeuwenhoekiella sp.]